jgi:hypothetical protein
MLNEMYWVLNIKIEKKSHSALLKWSDEPQCDWEVLWMKITSEAWTSAKVIQQVSSEWATETHKCYNCEVTEHLVRNCKVSLQEN